ncbi:MAG: Clp protease ClpP [Bacteroidales bacterium]|nr:Clp protease ClpP [Bacteroidales bacterium]
MRYYSLKQDGATADLIIFGDITSMRMLENDVSSYVIQQELTATDADYINVHINSYGGEVAEALAIYNTLKRHPAQVTTYVDGFACSAATIVFMAGDNRIMSNIGNFLVHPAWAGVLGNAEDLRREADNLDAITEQSITAYMEHVTKTRDELVDLMSEEKFLTPDEVLEWGFATEIEDASESDRPAASVKSLVHKLLTEKGEDVMQKSDLDAINDEIEALKAALESLSEKINQDEDEEDTEVDTDEESEQPEKQKADMMACFCTAMSTTKGE